MMKRMLFLLLLLWSVGAAGAAEIPRAPDGVYADGTAGLLSGIDEIGGQLTAHFPAQPGSAINSLPDSVVDE
jgi:uncharacterized membrane protein